MVAARMIHIAPKGMPMPGGVVNPMPAILGPNAFANSNYYDSGVETVPNLGGHNSNNNNSASIATNIAAGVVQGRRTMVALSGIATGVCTEIEQGAASPPMIHDGGIPTIPDVPEELGDIPDIPDIPEMPSIQNQASSPAGAPMVAAAALSPSPPLGTAAAAAPIQTTTLPGNGNFPLLSMAQGLLQQGKSPLEIRQIVLGNLMQQQQQQHQQPQQQQHMQTAQPRGGFAQNNNHGMAQGGTAQLPPQLPDHFRRMVEARMRQQQGMANTMPQMQANMGTMMGGGNQQGLHAMPQGLPLANMNLPQQQEAGFHLVEDEEDAAAKEIPVETQIVRSAPSEIAKDHYGLHHLVRAWLATALRRRSFPLLAKASELACKAGLEMDDVVSLKNLKSMFGKDFEEISKQAKSNIDSLGQFLAPAREEQTVIGERLQLHDIPLNDREALNMVDEEAVGNRWICLRMAKLGVMRFYMSPEFEKSVCTFQMIIKRWTMEQLGPRALFLSTEDAKSKVGLAVMQSVYAWRYHNTEPRFIRVPDVPIISVITEELIDVDFYLWMNLSLDAAIAHVEMIPRDGRLADKGRQLRHHRYHLQRLQQPKRTRQGAAVDGEYNGSGGDFVGRQHRGERTRADEDDAGDVPQLPDRLDQLSFDQLDVAGINENVDTSIFDSEMAGAPKKQRYVEEDEGRERMSAFDNLAPIPLEEWDGQIIPNLPLDKIGRLELAPGLLEDWMPILDALR